MKMDDKDMKEAVKAGYGLAAQQKAVSTCEERTSCCCGSDDDKAVSIMVGYGPEELATLPEGAIMGLGCGNPVALASLEEGMTVLDLGSGAGIDCFLAASKVGPSGRVIGIDMTRDMLDLARRNAEEGGFDNVEFREGEIEDLPVDEGTVDVVISNCVINLSPDKPRVFREAFRVLRPGGRLMVSDIVLTAELPEDVKEDIYQYVTCIAGASMREDYLRFIEEAGFEGVQVLEESSYGELDMVLSAKVSARKPAP
jgi:ubiquinone/menaquinone biosynthesis C-methylase UbiE